MGGNPLSVHCSQDKHKDDALSVGKDRVLTHGRVAAPANALMLWDW